MISDIRILSSMATRRLLGDLVAALARELPEDPVSVESMGGVEAAKRIAAGEPFDGVVLAAGALEALKAELERFGAANDRATAARARRMLNITRDTGEFLSVLARASGARRLLEIGTSNGYSTLWLAEAARATGGSVTTVELSEYKAGLAAATFARSGLEAHIALVRDDAARVLERAGEGAYDFVFLDSERTEYPGWWPRLRRALRPGGMLVADNATSHREQMARFVALVKADPAFATSLVPVGNGEFLAVKAA